MYIACMARLKWVYNKYPNIFKTCGPASRNWDVIIAIYIYFVFTLMFSLNFTAYIKMIQKLRRPAIVKESDQQKVKKCRKLLACWLSTVILLFWYGSKDHCFILLSGRILYRKAWRSHDSLYRGQIQKLLQCCHVSACGLADQCWIHKQKVVDSSPVTVKVLCPWVYT